MTHSFLLIGQSNMAGRGFLKDVSPICNEHIKMLRNGRWQMMFEPINYDRPNAGVGLSASFAASWLMDHPLEDIGLIPCAHGSTSLDDWNTSGALFANAVQQAKLAQRESAIEGILWHQGENDCKPGGAENYKDKLTTIINTLRTELNIKEVPLIVGALGDYLPHGQLFGSSFRAYAEVNRAIQDFAETTANCYFVTAAGLAPNPDGIHINAKSQRLFGIRYYKAYRDKQHILSQLQNEEALFAQIENQPITEIAYREMMGMQFSSGAISLEEYLAVIKPTD
ncbi:hypothetical protein M2459_000726 [Parabacteroides sp. PF5-5]|uniref:sialate O-acetylesterase n=1 Tax=unclassified Parabacteroides TaxID=2649774 RepID=UPI002476D72C|nr:MULTISPECIES: sialate O-acetylesterase [unclassified Parabacteroides]MDH6303999.1 hypothetical protein [Parabacteroides sp. PH5-39]MDH6315286.1 hypothetical protein [Parabacteroides sp. PF5-13]MDH6318946.1 hypothetical protein [Parabacteroides sp. PH5-13]MDH6322675.1 hypothetical protein [Parabacteroides sp. PH5-8]MDH6326188.1 hypothetical protein [Parabacteroides sp. PH5-41]